MTFKEKCDLWIQSLPEKAKEIALKYPPHTIFKIHDVLFYVISYESDGGLSVSRTNPFQDYKKAVSTKEAICECCLDKLDSLIYEPPNPTLN